MNSDDQLQKRYDENLRRFCQRWEDSLKTLPDYEKFKTGFIFLFVRDDQPDCTDIASNFDTDTQIHILEEVLLKLKVENQ